MLKHFENICLLRVPRINCYPTWNMLLSLGVIYTCKQSCIARAQNCSMLASHHRLVIKHCMRESVLQGLVTSSLRAVPAVHILCKHISNFSSMHGMVPV